jgi:CRP-like cAMP-binding protein
MNEEKRIRYSSFWANLFKSPAEKNDLEEVLLSMPPFQKINRKNLKSLMQFIHNREYTENEYIFYQGDPGIGLYIILRGEVAVRQGENSDEHDADLAILSRGDFFGELALLDNSPRSASAIATQPSNIAVIFKPDLDEYIDKYPKQGVDIMRGISQIIVTRLRNLNQDYIRVVKELKNK